MRKGDSEKNIEGARANEGGNEKESVSRGEERLPKKKEPNKNSAKMRGNREQEGV